MRAEAFSLQNIARYACFAAFMSTLFIYSPNVMTLFAFDSAEFTGLFAEPCLIATFSASCLLIVAELTGKSQGVVRFFDRKATKVCCIALYLLSCSFFIVCVVAQVTAISGFLAPIAVIAGIAVLGVCLLWSEAFDDIDLFQATVAVVVGLLASALLHTISARCTWPVALALELVLLCVGVIPLTFESKRLCPDGTRAVQAAVAEVETPSLRLNHRAFFSIMGIPLVGMAISSLAIGIRPFYIFDETVNVQVLGMFIAVLLALPLIALRKRQPLYVYVYQVYLPVLISVATAFVIIFGSGALHEAAVAFLCATFTLATVIAIAASAAVSNAREFPRGLVFATLIAVYSGLGITGIRIGAMFTDLYNDNQRILAVLAVLYTCGMLVFSSLKVWKATTGSAGDDHLEVPDAAPIAPAQETFEERLAKISEMGGLSARETEIMSYVGKGHTSVYVAKTLLISDSTVYTHVRNIYKKLGISSREELIQLFNDSNR